MDSISAYPIDFRDLGDILSILSLSLVAFYMVSSLYVVQGVFNQQVFLADVFLYFPIQFGKKREV